MQGFFWKPETLEALVILRAVKGLFTFELCDPRKKEILRLWPQNDIADCPLDGALAQRVSG